ncbi:hypothetical protein GCM10010421_09180 [Streptomyces glaucus]|uniref:Secreted protein n=1 Tax=Streptomyces glaucus TaxID=284029 RepID=A0ABN3JAS4_9ACTN
MAGRYQDTMGFTATGPPPAFLAGGHPAPAGPGARSPRPGPIRSTDAGRTRQTLSAGARPISTPCTGRRRAPRIRQPKRQGAGRHRDGRSWDERARSTALDPASHPGSAARARVAAGTGLERGTGGGRSFRPVSSASPLVAVEEPEPGSLGALTADGSVLTGRGDGPWTQLGRLPEGGRATVPAAVSPRRPPAADSTDAVYESADGGRTWMLRHRPVTGREYPWPYTPWGYMVAVVGPPPAHTAKPNRG